LVITPIAKEGFIFILHKDNPIDSLTQQQLRGIYSGRITNWSEVGGLDERIISYTRNWDSGSQTAMTDFMGGEEIVGQEDWMFSMGFMLTAVEEAGSAGIGYNILSWSTQQNLDNMGLKAVAVDGIKPNNETLADSSYPLMVYTYSYYNEGNEKGRSLTEWLLTDEGQRVIASADYVGVFGELPPKVLPDLYKDENSAAAEISNYYTRNGFNYAHVWNFPERQTDKELIESFADGKGKDVTVLYLVNFWEYDYDAEVFDAGHTIYDTRFIVLTRERGGKFEVINEGEWLP
jgi:hypothetical protein